MTFRIIVDTREQASFSFDCPTVRRKLDAGDYSVDGYADRVAVERKSLADFTHTVIHDFTRFANELEKLARLDASCVVVEADLDAVLRGRHADTIRGVAPRSLLGATIHIAVKFRVRVVEPVKLGEKIAVPLNGEGRQRVELRVSEVAARAEAPESSA